MRRARRGSACCTRCIIDTARATTTWKYIAPIQEAAWERKTFAYGTWGGEIRREFERGPAISWPGSTEVPVVSPIRTSICSSRKHGIHKLIVIGLIAHTCVEATVRYAAELVLRGHGGEGRYGELLG